MILRPRAWLYATILIGGGLAAISFSVTTAVAPTECHGVPMAEDAVCEHVKVGKRRYEDFDYQAKSDRDLHHVYYSALCGVLALVAGGAAIRYRRPFDRALREVEEQRRSR